MDPLSSIRKPPRREHRSRPWAGLPNVRSIRSRGRQYLYFNAGGRDRDYHRLPDPDSPRFEVVYRALMDALETGGDIAGIAKREFERCAEPRSVVYFVRAATGPIKIGVAFDVSRRLAALQTASPVALELVATTPGRVKLEREYHRQFAEHRLHGEWFSPHPDILAEIERLSP